MMLYLLLLTMLDSTIYQLVDVSYKKSQKKFASAKDIPNFSASNGWLEKFKKRNDISFKCLTGNSAEVDENAAKEWRENILCPLLEDYDEKNIFNADESALFYQCLPGKTMALKGDRCLKGKYSKIRLTILLGANMDGSEKLKPLVIGKSGKPRCFKNIRSLPVDYKFNRKAWMTGEIFENWLVSLDTKFCRENRKILFFFDNCSAHPKNIRDKLKSIKLCFFPPNMTSKLQPMDMGIIRSLKVNYRHKIVQIYVNAIENNLNLPKINLLDGINLLSEVWITQVTDKTIKNCFKKAGFIKSLTPCDDNSDIDADVNAIENDAIQKFNLIVSSSLIDHQDFANYVNIDNDVVTAQDFTDIDIMQSISENSNSLTNNEVSADITNMSDEETDVNVSRLEVNKSLDTIQQALNQCPDIPSDCFENFFHIKQILQKYFSSSN